MIDKYKKGKKDELERLYYFGGRFLHDVTEKDLEDYFIFSETGKEPQIETKGYKGLNEAKRWQGIHMEMYEEGILDGSMPYIVILDGAPRVAVDFMKKEMFKGIDAEIIEKCYQSLL